VADDDLALHDAWGAGDGVGEIARDQGIGLPDQFPAGRVDGEQATVDGSHVYLAVPQGRTAIHHVAAGTHTPFARHLSVEAPQRLTGCRIEGQHVAPGGSDVENAIHHQWRGFLAARDVEVRVPGQAEFTDVAAVDG